MSRRFAALGVILALVVVVGCSKSTSKSSGGANIDRNVPGANIGGGPGRPGVTETEIKVGGVVGKTNPIGRPYEDAAKGAKAYLDEVNAKGGLYGKRFVTLPVRDDQSRASKNISETKALVNDDKVFAVLPVVTNAFQAASFLKESGTPTFGWNIQKEWGSAPNLFGEKGSFLCFGCNDVQLGYMVQKLGLKRAAILSYDVDQSKTCADGIEKSMQNYGTEVVYKNTGLGYGFPDASADAKKIEDAKADVLFTCMDVNGNVTVGRSLKGYPITVLSPEGYDPETPKKYGQDIEGWYFRTAFVPFEATQAASQGMKDYKAAAKKYRFAENELSLAGWLNAALLVRGLKDAGPEFTQATVVESINKISDWTADGILSSVDWTLLTPEGVRTDTPDGSVSCDAWLIVKDGKFTPTFSSDPTKPFVCFPKNANPIPAPTNQ